jgi:4-amino-4-deoxy-L-arabinose transferase-like glycosyltransferase
MKKGKFIILIGLALIVTRLPMLFSPFIDVDEALFAVFARVWQHGGIPYVDAVEGKAMGIYYFYALASWLAGSLPDINMLAVHILGIIWVGLTAWVIGRIAARLAGECAGLWAALFFVLFTSFFVPKIIATSMEVVLLLPVCLAMDLLLRDADQIRPVSSFLAGVLISIAMIVKYQAGIMIPIIVVYFWLLRLPPRKAFVHTLLFGLGGIPAPLMMLWHLHSGDALPDFWHWNFGHSLYYIKSGSATIDLGRKLLSHVATFIAATLLVWVLTAQRFGTWCRNGWSAWRREPLEAGVWIWFFLSIIPVCMGRRFYGHYFLLVMPQLSILAALKLVSWDATAWRRCRKWVVGLILFPLALSLYGRFNMRPFYVPMHEEYIDDYKPYGDYLKSRTQPDDRILVWGYSPAVYWFAERLPATRFLWSDLLVGRIFGLQRDLEGTFDHNQFVQPIVWEMFFVDVAKHPPAYIIDMAPTGLHNYQNFPISNYPQLKEFLAGSYVAEPDFLGAKLFRHKGLKGSSSGNP